VCVNTPNSSYLSNMSRLADDTKFPQLKNLRVCLSVSKYVGVCSYTCFCLCACVYIFLHACDMSCRDYDMKCPHLATYRVGTNMHICTHIPKKCMRTQIYVYTHLYTYIHTNAVTLKVWKLHVTIQTSHVTHKKDYVRTHTHTFICIYVCIYIYVCVCIYVYVYIYIYVYTCLCVSVCVCVCVCVELFMCTI